MARILDLGCGDCKLLALLAPDSRFTELVGVDASPRQLVLAETRLKEVNRRQPGRVRLLQGSLVYRDQRLQGFDAVALVEVIEHLDPPRLATMERVVFEFAAPRLIVVTTPNAEYNVQFATLAAERLRHRDHRFEWRRHEFQQWAERVARRFGYRFEVTDLGPGRPCAWSAVTDGGFRAMTIQIPELSLVILMGASGSGKSTFARRHFRPTEILSSDFCRGLVSDDESNQAATADAFAVLRLIAQKRLAAGKLTVIDATNVQKEARKPLLELAKAQHVLAVVIVLDVPAEICQARNAGRTDRRFGPHVIRQQVAQLKKSLRHLEAEGFRYRHVLSSPEEIEVTSIERQPLWNNRKWDRGPFDIIGDVHGCYEELVELLERLGYEFESDGGVIPPTGRKAVFLGDLVDRGPMAPQVVELVRAMVTAGHALCVPGNHDAKFVRAARGHKVKQTHGLTQTLEQYALWETEHAGAIGRRGGFSGSAGQPLRAG